MVFCSIRLSLHLIIYLPLPVCFQYLLCLKDRTPRRSGNKTVLIPHFKYRHNLDHGWSKCVPRKCIFHVLVNQKQMSFTYTCKVLKQKVLLEAVNMSNTDMYLFRKEGPLSCHNLQDSDMKASCVPANPRPSAMSLKWPSPLVFWRLNEMKWAYLLKSAGKPHGLVSSWVHKFMSEEEEQQNPCEPI